MDIINGIKQSPVVYPFNSVGKYNENAKYFVPGVSFHSISTDITSFDDLEFQLYPCFFHEKTYIKNLKFNSLGSLGDPDAEMRLVVYLPSSNNIPSRLFFDSGVIDMSTDGVKTKTCEKYFNRGQYFYGWISSGEMTGAYKQSTRYVVVSGVCVYEPILPAQSFHSLTGVQQSSSGGNVFSNYKFYTIDAYTSIPEYIKFGAPQIIDPSSVYCNSLDSQSGFPIVWFEQGEPS